MATYQQIQNDVEGWLRDLPTSTLSAIPGLVNDALLDLQRYHGWRCMEKSTTFVTSGVVALGTIARFRGAHGQPYRISGLDGTRTPMDWLDSLQSLSDLYGTSALVVPGEPNHVYIAGVDDDNTASLEAWRPPDTLSDWNDGNYRIQVSYYQFVAPLAAPTDSNWFTTNCTEALRLLTLYRAHALNLDESRAQQYYQMAQQSLMDARKLERSSRGGARTFSYRTGSKR